MHKRTLIIVFIIILFVVIAGFILLSLFKGKTTEKKEIIQSTLSSMEPTIELSQNPTKPTDENVSIEVKTQIDGDSTIESITLPNKQVVAGNTTVYEVKENGQYTFIVKATNGKTAKSTIVIDNITKSSADNPYIPDGFSKVKIDDIDSKEFIIEDKNGNQFVWVPVETGNLLRNTNNDEQYAEIDSTASELVNSVAKYYGFYIARYEASKYEENNIIAAKSTANSMPWSNVNYEDAYKAAINTATVFKYSGIKTALVNSYAWDTTLDWLDKKVKNYSNSTSYSARNQGTIVKTGTDEVDNINSIYGMAGNLREWTTEVYYPTNSNPVEENEDVEVEENKETEIEEKTYRVVRGGSANINKTASSRIGQPDNMSDIYWGFRIIIYKE